jgi:hypothetical protein
LDQGLNVLLHVYAGQGVKEPFPLNSDKLFEASTAVEERSVKVENDGLDIL